MSDLDRASAVAMETSWIISPDDTRLGTLCADLDNAAGALEGPGAWPARQLERCAECGVFSWFVSRQHGGQGWSEADVVRGYLQLSAACLTTTFVITQRIAASRRIEQSSHARLRDRLLADLVHGRLLATVGISHLTTSRQHLRRPALAANPTADGWRLSGFTPWVTGARHAQILVAGAVLPDGQQILVAVPTDLTGIHVQPPQELVALSASCTGQVDFEQVEVGSEWLLAGPAPQVLAVGTHGGTGGLQTSSLAAGLAERAIRWLKSESQRRPDLAPPAAALEDQWAALRHDLLQLADGHTAVPADDVRSRANSLALRATQAALSAAKGAGYLRSHPVGRWCREALFFLVWSCPQPVVEANLCEFAAGSG